MKCAALMLLADVLAAAMATPGGCEYRGLPSAADIAKETLGLLQSLPDSVERVVEVALHVRPRHVMAKEAVRHPSGPILGEVLVQLVNAGESSAVSLLAELLTEEAKDSGAGGCLLYTNDVHVLVEILLREIPRHRGIEGGEHVRCLQAILKTYEAARAHRTQEVRLMLEDVRAEAA